MTDTLFLFTLVAGTPVAVRASEIEAVVRLGEVVPIPLAPPHVRGLAALRSRVLTVIHMETQIFGKARGDAPAIFAIVAEIGGHSYAFCVDALSDICHAQGGVLPVQGRIDAAWAPFAGGLVEREGQSHLLLTLADFIAGSGSAARAA